MDTAWTYEGHDGTQWVVRADTIWQAREAARRAELRRTDSAAAADLAARSVVRYQRDC